MRGGAGLGEAVGVRAGLEDVAAEGEAIDDRGAEAGVGVGPVVATAIIAEVRDVSRFRNRDHFASCDGTAPIEVSSGGRKVHRLSRRGNRRINHAIYMAAITQIRQPHGDGRA